MRHGDGIRKMWGMAFLLAVAVGAAPVMAEEHESSRVLPDWISLSAGVDVTTQYNFRGIFQEDQGSIVQPWAEAGFSLYADGDGFIKSLDATIGMWHSIHDGPSTAGIGGDHYEGDYYVGFTAGLPHNFSVDVTWVSLTAPDFTANIFAEEFDITVAYDDSEYWGDDFMGLSDFSGFQPYIMYVIETDGASDGDAESDGGDSYIEIGIEPSFTLVQSMDYPITMSVPMTIGLNSSGYYEFGTSDDNDTFAFFDVGLVFGMPLAFMGDTFGSWETYVAVDFLFLSDMARNSGSGLDSTEIIGTWGISVTY